MSKMDEETKEQVEKISEAVKLKASDMPGVTEPTGFFDPLGFTTDVSDGTLLFYREAELKHGRVCMLASLGFLVGEQFHPLFGGDIDGPSFSGDLFSSQALGPFWLAVLVAAGGIELLTSGGRWEGTETQGITQELTPGTVPGDLGFDPLSLKPDDPEQL